MPATPKKDKLERHLHKITKLLSREQLDRVAGVVNEMHPAEIAHVFEALKPSDREIAWPLIDSELRGETLVELNEEVRRELIDATNTDDLVDAVESLETDDLADLVDDLPETALHQILASMDNKDRQRLESVLSYDEHSAGGLMNTDTLTISPEVTLNVVFRYLRMRGEIPDLTDSLMVVDQKDKYLGLLPLSLLLTSNVKEKVSEFMISHIDSIPADLPAAEVAMRFEQQDLVSAPVVDSNGKLLGRITIDDVVDVIRDEADHSVMSRAGLDEEQDMFAPVTLSAKRRAVWLGINLVTALFAAAIIGLFEDTLEKMVALAILMPIVASMGGVAGTQTLTLVIRGLALHQIGRTNALILVGKELAIGALNGVFWALTIAIIAGLWFENPAIGVLIGSALIINLICAAFAGATIPMLLNRIGVDPALAGGVILTTITDVIGFLTFLGLATLYLR